MCEHEQVHCPRCNSNFQCKAGSIMLCQCVSVTLNDAEREYIREAHDGCLCAPCMNELKKEYNSGLFHEKLQRISTLFNYK